MNVALNMNSTASLNEKSVLSILSAASTQLQLDIIVDWLVYVKSANDSAIVATIARMVMQRTTDRYLAVVAKSIMKDESMMEFFTTRFQTVLEGQPVAHEPAAIIAVDPSSIEFEPAPHGAEARLAADCAAMDGWDHNDVA